MDARIDCNDLSPSIFPNDSEEIYFNGIDDNCDSRDGDGDRDGDGYWSVDYPFGSGDVDASVTLPENLDDCWDDPSTVPAGFDAVNGFTPLLAEEVHPAAVDRWYDGVNQDCLEDSDFDQDGDGFVSSYFANRTGAFGDDCVDSVYDPEYIDVGIVPLYLSRQSYGNLLRWCGSNDFLSDYDQDEDGQDAEGSVVKTAMI